MTYQYYYKNNKCPAGSSTEPDCICWYDEGTGPFSDLKYSTYIENPTVTLVWREKPVNKVTFPTTGHNWAPTEEDADKNGYVQVLSEFGWELVYWSDWALSPGVRPWRHTMFWKPKMNRDILEEALTSLSILKRSADAPVPIHSKHLNNIDQALKILREKL
jgi:hypothetical protein